TGEVLAEALAWARASEGAFDPCLGGVSRLWNVAERREPPAPEDVARMAGSRPYQALEVVSGHAAARVALHEVGSAVDLGGIAKGFGVDMAARALRDQGVFDALVNVGGDLVAMGVGEGDRPWRVGVRSPGSAETIVHTVELSDEAVATSGDYLRFFQHGGRRYHHLMDAREGGPSRSGLQSLTVVASTCMAADAAATTGFVGGTGLLAETIRRVAPGTRVVHSI
ncbi:MAG: FAD:protein FMN transferase, partial [Gemmatimonadota bacterium]|nr:FAD:protein FMN transferase [Gemmatimonadota bacterium]